MKLLSNETGVIVLSIWVLSLLNYINAAAANWKLYCASDENLYYYDAGSITNFKGVSIKVSEKSVAREIKQHSLAQALTEIAGIEKKSGSEISGELRKERINTMALQEIRRLYEIRCPAKMYRIITGMEYDKEETLIDGITCSKWEYVHPHSITEKLYEAVCRGPESGTK